MVTLYYLNKDGTVATNNVLEDEVSFWVSQGWSQTNPQTGQSQQLGEYVPDPAYLSYYTENEIIRTPDGKIYLKAGVPVRWTTATTPSATTTPTTATPSGAAGSAPTTIAPTINQIAQTYELDIVNSNAGQEEALIRQFWQQTYGSQPTAGQIKAVTRRGGYLGAGNDFFSGVDRTALQNAIVSVGGTPTSPPQGETGAGTGAATGTAYTTLTDLFKQNEAAIRAAAEAAYGSSGFQSILQQERDMLVRKFDLSKAQIGYEKQALLDQYDILLDAIEQGRIRAGSDYERQRLYELQQKQYYLDNKEAELDKNLNTIIRSSISRGGLFSGALQTGMAEEKSATQRVIEAYESANAEKLAQMESDYQKSLEDYAAQRKKYELGKTSAEQEAGYKTQVSDYERQQTLLEKQTQEAQLKEALLQQELERQSTIM